MSPRTRSKARSARDIVESRLTETQSDSAVHPTPEADAPVLTGLFDYPPDDVRSCEHVTGRRASRSTERNKEYRKEFRRGETKRLRSNETRARNQAVQVRIKQTNKARRRNRGSRSRNSVSNGEVPGSGEERGRSQTIRGISRSPTPGSTDCEPDSADQARTQSQFTYVYETLDHEGLIRYAQEEFGVDGRGCDTQAIIKKLQLAQAEQETEVGTPRRPPSIIFNPSKPIRVGGGWSQDVVPRLPADRSTRKRAHDASYFSSGSSKRQRASSPEDTATEPETEDELVNRHHDGSNIRAGRNIPPTPTTATNTNSVGQSRPTMTAHLPSRESTVPTVIDTNSTFLSSLGDSDRPWPYYVTLSPSRSRNDPPKSPSQLSRDPSPENLLPSFTVPVRGPVHARLRENLYNRYLDAVDHEAEAAAALANPASAPSPNADSLLEEIPGTEPEGSSPENRASSASNARGQGNPHRTYGRTQRTSVLPQPGNSTSPAIIVNPTLSRSSNTGNNTNIDGNEDVPTTNSNRPSSPCLSASQLVRKERARAAAAKAQVELLAQLPSQGSQRRRSLAAAKAPHSRPQACPAPGGRGYAIGRRSGGTRRLDPVSAARADMIAFNQAVARGEATSFVESVTRQSQRTARCAPPASRPLDALLEDDEESLAQAEALAKSKWPATSSSGSRRIYKQKPLARDISGLERQVLIMAKVHLFAYALVEGVYQTRATYLRWAAAVHFATWQMELPDRPYEKPPNDVFEIMVNNIATLRGKIKERLRDFVTNVTGFEQNLANQQVMLENLAKFDQVYPNSFHCKTYTPRKGDYEHPEIGRCIALAFFYGPGSVGVVYPDYFRDMPITIVAFALAMWQFCIEEWANGWHQNGDLGMAAMHDKYEGQLAGLKEMGEVAPKRLSRLQGQWRNYVAEYSGAVFVSDEEVTGSPHKLNIRPDTPEPAQGAAISVEEMNDRLLETARQASLQERAQEIAAREFEETPLVSESDSCAPSPSPPPVEFNEHGVLTAQSKGKSRVN